MHNFNIKQLLAEKADLVNCRIEAILGRWAGIQPKLNEAIRYVLAAPGKRVRAALVLLCCELVSGKVNDDALNAAAAIEMMHCSSLIHDDLPAMDDDDFRRGRPSCHKAFDEATAILAGDALIIMAFEVFARDVSTSAKGAEMVKILAQAAGPAGMIAGQMDDLIAEHSKPDVQKLELIHINKTAKMFQAATSLGAVAGGADEKQKQSLSQYGLNIGLAFQVADDILDVVSDTQTLGKTAGKDIKQGKVTYPALFGLDESRKKAENIVACAVKNLEPFGDKAEVLKSLATEIIERTK